MIEKINRLLDICNNHEKDIEDNYLYSDALLYEFEKMYEDSTKLSIHFYAEHPEIPTDKLRAIRNRVAHDYESIVVQILIDTVKKDLPIFQKLLQSILDKNS